MSNLLPETSQKNLLREFRARFVLLGSLLSIATACISALALLPSFIMLYTTQPEIPATVKQNETDLVDVATIQLLVDQYTPVLGTASTTRALRAILGHRPNDARIDRIAYAAGSPSTFVVSGLAGSRDSISKYLRDLQDDTYFSKVMVPVGDLVGAKGGRFQLTVTGDF